MRCEGVREATKQTCGSPVYRCKDCGHVGCNQGSDGVCDKQAFRAARCKGCNKIGSQRLVKDESDVRAAS